MLRRLEAAAKARIPLAARQVVRRALQRGYRRPLQRRLATGVEVRIADESDWTIYNDIFVEGEYDTPILDTLKSSLGRERDLTILDLGANVGLFTLRVADLLRRRDASAAMPHVVVVEGNPRTYEVLRATLERNGLLGETLVAINGLIGERAGVGRITRHAVSGMSTVHGGTARFTERVPFVDLGDLVPSRRIDLLKCDIEGSEESFIANYPDLLSRTERAVFELHPRFCDVARCVELLASAGLAHSVVLRSHPLYEVSYFTREPAGAA